MKKLLRSTLLFTLISSHYAFGQLTPTFDDILITMRDNEQLEADVYLPSGPGPFEVILIQTPYGKDNIVALPFGIGFNVDSQPYAFVIVDWRGFYGSSGAAPNGGERGQDGYDVCEWITQQSWHGSRIGTWGPSALGKVQYDTAFEHHPAHTCAVPLVAHPQFTYDDYFFGGVLEESKLQQLDALGYGLSPIVLSNVYYSGLWATAEAQTWTPTELHIPTLQIGGWYDHNIDKMLQWYADVRSNVPLAVQDEQWLLIGPWVHGGPGVAYVGSNIQGELTYPNAAGVSDDMAWDFFNYYLLDSVNNWQSTAPITYYETGINQWVTSTASTIGSTQYNTLYLSENNSLASSTGNSLSSFTCNPNLPSPTIGGPTLNANLDQGPYDQSSLLGRSDLVSFSTPSLTQNVHVTGSIELHVYFSSDQMDGDIAVRLVDEYPDGRNMLITDGIRRMRFRNGFTASDESLVTPGTIYEMTVTLPFTDYTWLAGHKIKVIISGNNSTRWDVNLQNGGAMYQPGTANIATINIHHNATHPSSVKLPGSNNFLGIPEHLSDLFSIHPNPAKDQLSISSDVDLDFGIIRSINGEKVMEISSGVSQIDISSLKQGIYLIEFISSSGTTIKRFVKQ